MRRTFSLTPTVSIRWAPSDEKDPKPKPKSKPGEKPYLIVTWNHIGDRMAQKYVLCLDDKEIQYVCLLIK
jgi:hypothetical protein